MGPKPLFCKNVNRHGAKTTFLKQAQAKNDQTTQIPLVISVSFFGVLFIVFPFPPNCGAILGPLLWLLWGLGFLGPFCASGASLGSLLDQSGASPGASLGTSGGRLGQNNAQNKQHNSQTRPNYIPKTTKSNQKQSTNT